MSDKVAALKELIFQSGQMVVLTGAGISTESGIPDFRSPGGIWETFRIIQYDDFMTSEEARLEDWRRRFYMEDQLGEVQPNTGHQVLRDWVNEGICQTIITQNIDGLHQAAGTPQDRMIELHGNARRAYCTACGQIHEIADCRDMLEQTNQAPRCRQCDGIVKAAVVMFGEQMPQEVMQQAIAAASGCRLIVAIGTSLSVYPAAGLPLLAKQAGARFAILNRDQTDLDDLADVVVNAGIGESLTEIQPAH